MHERHDILSYGHLITAGAHEGRRPEGASNSAYAQYYYALGRQCTQTLPYLAEVCIPACS